MARNRMTLEKHQRDAKKKRKAEEKRALKLKRKEEPATEPELEAESPPDDALNDG